MAGGQPREPTVNIRIISDMITALLGNNSPTEGIGHKPVELCTVMTDGSVEAHDVLRIAGDGFTTTKFNIFDHAIDEVRNEPRWKAARDASINLCEKCRNCKFMSACGGGYLPHRFSKQDGYDNPSVYCDDLYSMLENMQSVLEGHLYVSKPGGERVNVRHPLGWEAPSSRMAGRVARTGLTFVVGRRDNLESKHFSRTGWCISDCSLDRGVRR